MPFIFQNTTSSSGSQTIVSGFQTASLLLSAAALTGGAVLLSATGSVPQRITTATETYITGTTNGRHGVAFDPDGVHVWVGDSSLHQLKRYRLSDGVIDYAITGSTTDPTKNTMTGGPSTLKIGYGNRLWFVTESTHMIGFIDVSTATPSCEIFSGSGLPSNTVEVCEHAPGRVLVRAGGGTAASTYSEFAYSGTGSLNTIAYTGQQIIEGTTFWSIAADLSGNVYTTNSTLIAKRSATTLTASATFTPPSPILFNIPGYGGFYRDLVYYPNAAKLLVKATSENDWMQINVADMTLEGRVYPCVEFGNPMSLFNSSYDRAPLTFSPDGSIQAHVTFEREANATTYNHLRTLRLNPQRARWTWTPGANVHAKVINLTGMFASMLGSMNDMPANTWLNSEYDLRKTKFYYSLDGGSTRTEFQPGSFIDVAVTSVQTMTIDVEMQNTPRNHFGVAPWVGDRITAGLAGHVVYTVD